MSVLNVGSKVIYGGDRYTIVAVLPFVDTSYYYELRAEGNTTTIFLLLFKEC